MEGEILTIEKEISNKIQQSIRLAEDAPVPAPFESYSSPFIKESI